MNVSGTLNSLRILYNPSLFLPTTTISTFASLPIPLPEKVSGTPIKVVLLDKDNCFAVPHTNDVFAEYQDVFAKLRKEYPGDQLMIVSNTAGSTDDPELHQAAELEKATGVKVIQHHDKKPGCGGEIIDYLKKSGIITKAEEVSVVGDRLMTDVVMANLMGSASVWIRDGVVPSKSPFIKFEHGFYDYMRPESKGGDE